MKSILDRFSSASHTMLVCVRLCCCQFSASKTGGPIHYIYELYIVHLYMRCSKHSIRESLSAEVQFGTSI